MNKHHQQAEQPMRKVLEDLQRLLPQDGEDISCYNPCVVDDSILDLVKVRTLARTCRRGPPSNRRITHEVRCCLHELF